MTLKISYFKKQGYFSHVKNISNVDESFSFFPPRGEMPLSVRKKCPRSSSEAFSFENEIGSVLFTHY